MQMNDFVSNSTHKLFNLVAKPEFCRQLFVWHLKNLDLWLYTKKHFSSYIIVDFSGRRLRSPIGVAAGYDVNGECIKGLRRIGFGFVEIGTVTPEPQSARHPQSDHKNWDGSIFYVPHRANDGFDKVYDNLLKYRQKKGKSCIGVNIGHSNHLDPVPDYVLGIKKFQDVADYVSFNVTTDEEGSKFHELNVSNLLSLIPEVKKVINESKAEKPLQIFLKLSPELSDEECVEISKIIQDPETAVDGIILTNGRSEKKKDLDGRLGGRPLKDFTKERIKLFYKLTNGSVQIIASGGIQDGQDAYDMIACGASFVQIYTSFTETGYGTPMKINKSLNYLTV
ncbi:Dihydroorotate dehydrogenase (quinone), mitochondrial [Thelohanellus kitauei]|uniref:Dihydroorotate dehydrogenase (quinone), mitochondrial n=1 Tax=Thelohanellus kitauei TaxID=669202 RepID=A0A0C2JRB5_THEKT|nr:Dihydroorotate dehydrogenase (quinone), mitochondrial [Thelohanellus kitauei]